MRIANGSELGTLCLVDRAPRVFGDEDQALLHDLAKMAEQEIAALQFATMDELTALSNRRGFEALAQQGLSLCRRLNRPAALMFFDLDRFNQINDRFGHAEGDQALVNFSRLLKHTCRDADALGRLGGDEFAVLATNTGPENLERLVERFQQAVAAHNAAAQCGYDLLYSVGVVAFDSGRHATVGDLLAEADDLMYAQKERRKAAH